MWSNFCIFFITSKSILTQEITTWPRQRWRTNSCLPQPVQTRTSLPGITFQPHKTFRRESPHWLQVNWLANITRRFWKNPLSKLPKLPQPRQTSFIRTGYQFILFHLFSFGCRVLLSFLFHFSRSNQPSSVTLFIWSGKT